MSVQLRIVHSQWNDLRKAIHDTQRKFIVSDALRSHNLTPSRIVRNLSSSSKIPAGVSLKATQTDTRRNFYLSKRRRQLSFLKDQEFFDKLEKRKEQVSLNRILYSNVKPLEKAVRQPSQSQHKPKLYPQLRPPPTPTTPKNSYFWISARPQKESLTQGLKKRFQKRDDIKLHYDSFCYEPVF